jgi:D-methionine transport system substrate-binding protein
MKASKEVTPLAKATKSAGKQTKLISSIVLVGLFISLLTACSPAAATPAAETPAATVAATEATAAAVAATEPPAAPVTTVAPAAAEAAKVINLKIGASPVPHGDILKYIQQNLAKDAGLNLEIVEFTDYVQPNLALADGQLDANFFQHVPYLEDFSKEHKLDLVPVVAVHIEPLGLYSKKVKALADIPEKAVIAIPNDATNGGRALNLLAANGLLTLKEGVSTTATVKDIVDNPKKLDIKEVEAAQLVRTLDDVTAAVINGNYAIEAKLKPNKDALVLESGENNPYANVLAVKKGRENDEGIQKLAKLLTSPEVKKFIEDKYEGAVIPAFK